MRSPKLSPLVFALTCAMLSPVARADEGMWLFNQFPKDLVEKKYGYQVSDEFL